MNNAQMEEERKLFLDWVATQPKNYRQNIKDAFERGESFSFDVWQAGRAPLLARIAELEEKLKEETLMYAQLANAILESKS